jgi:hypothetical protein
VVGDGHRRHPVVGHAVQEGYRGGAGGGGDARRAVEERELRMGVEMNEAVRAHLSRASVSRPQTRVSRPQTRRTCGKPV